MSAQALTVVLCTHNPDPARLARTLLGLRAQTLPSSAWTTVLIDNASQPPVSLATLGDVAPAGLRIVAEPVLGLNAARRRGLVETGGDIVVFVDDDNVLAPDYLAQTLAAFDRLPRVGALGGRSLPEFSKPPADDDWRREFFPLLALRDPGEVEKISRGLRPPGSTRDVYPDYAPIGAGLALRRRSVHAWLAQTEATLSDRCGASLASAGDNEIVFSVLRSGWEVAYIPTLALTHLIPDARLSPAYLARLNRGIQKSWMQLLHQHHACPWPPLSRAGIRLRKLKAWFTHRVWTGQPAAHIRWQGACGHFEGRAQTPPPRP